MYTIRPNLTALRAKRLPLGGGMAISGGGGEGALEKGGEKSWGADGQVRETIGGEDQQRVVN